MKINEVQQELRATAAANNECEAEGRTARAPTKPKTMNVSAAGNARSQPAADASKKVRGAQNALQYCARLSDGYCFPTPNSQFKQKGGVGAALIQCKIICKTEAMAVSRTKIIHNHFFPILHDRSAPWGLPLYPTPTAMRSVAYAVIKTKSSQATL